MLLDCGCDPRSEDELYRILAVAALSTCVDEGTELSKDLLMATGGSLSAEAGLSALGRPTFSPACGNCDALIPLLLAAGVKCRSEFYCYYMSPNAAMSPSASLSLQQIGPVALIAALLSLHYGELELADQVVQSAAVRTRKCRKAAQGYDGV
jgi:hypothetical protein